MKCNICGSKTLEIFKDEVLGKYNVSYYQCERCDFIQTETPFWLDEAYSKAIAQTDIGLVERNQKFAPLVEQVITSHFSQTDKFLDYAGGYGLFTRMMRDRGYDFYHFDPYCKNIFAGPFEVKKIKDNKTYELITAFELFEHIEDPVNTISKLLLNSKSILFSTKLINTDCKYSSTKDWWYFAPETGQHISFYSKGSLEVIAEKVNCNLITDENNFHLITTKDIKDLFPSSFLVRKSVGFLKKVFRIDFEIFDSHVYVFPNQRNNSLLQKDYNRIKRKLIKQHGN